MPTSSQAEVYETFRPQLSQEVVTSYNVQQAATEYAIPSYGDDDEANSNRKEVAQPQPPRKVGKALASFMKLGKKRTSPQGSAAGRTTVVPGPEDQVQSGGGTRAPDLGEGTGRAQAATWATAAAQADANKVTRTASEWLCDHGLERIAPVEAKHSSAVEARTPPTSDSQKRTKSQDKPPPTSNSQKRTKSQDRLKRRDTANGWPSLKSKPSTTPAKSQSSRRAAAKGPAGFERSKPPADGPPASKKATGEPKRVRSQTEERMHRLNSVTRAKADLLDCIYELKEMASQGKMDEAKLKSLRVKYEKLTVLEKNEPPSNRMVRKQPKASPNEPIRSQNTPNRTEPQPKSTEAHHTTQPTHHRRKPARTAPHSEVSNKAPRTPPSTATPNALPSTAAPSTLPGAAARNGHSVPSNDPPTAGTAAGPGGAAPRERREKHFQDHLKLAGAPPGHDQSEWNELTADANLDEEVRNQLYGVFEMSDQGQLQFNADVFFGSYAKDRQRPQFANAPKVY